MKSITTTTKISQTCMLSLVHVLGHASEEWRLQNTVIFLNVQLCVHGSGYLSLTT